MLEPEDIANPKAYADPKKLDELFIRLRRDNPVVWVEPKGFQPFWAITKFADIKEILLNPRVFKSNPQPLLQPKASEDERMKKYGRPSVVQTLIHMDPPNHQKYRDVAQSWIKQENFVKFKDSIRTNAKEYVNSLISFGGECEFVSTFAKVYPLRNIMMLLGLPRTDEEYLVGLTDRIFFPDDPIIAQKYSGDVQGEAQEEMKQYFKKIIEDRRSNPKDDMLTLAANAKIDGQPIPELELLSILVSFATAGHDTTAGVIAGSVLAFAQYPEVLQQIKNNLTLIPTAVEEMIRWVAPARNAARTAAEDYEIRGHKIKAGQRVVLCLYSACRDEEQINDPFKIQVDRKPNNHLAFGFGSHTCLGQHFSRFETTIFFEELIPRLEWVQLNGEYTYTQALQVSRLRILPIKYKLNEKKANVFEII